MQSIYKNTIEERIFGRLFLLCLFIPHTNILFLLIPIITCLFLKFKYSDKSVSIPFINIIFVCVIIVSFILNNNRIEDTKPILEFCNILLLFSLFPYVKNIEIVNRYIYIAIIIVLLSQFAYILKIQPIISFIDFCYPADGIFKESYERLYDNVNLNNLTSYRIGGIFRNPNHCAKYTTLLLGIFLVENYNKKKDKRFKCCLISCFFIIFLTGSRTGLIVMSAMFIYSFIISKEIRINKKIDIIVLVSIFFIFLVGFFSFSVDKYRFFSIEQGMNDSALLKLEVLLEYLSTESSNLRLLFGNLSYSFYEPVIHRLYSFDSEYGYLIFSYGFLGILVYLIFIVEVFFKLKKSQRTFMIFLLWSFSSSIIFAFKTSFLFFLILSKYYSDTNKIKTK